MENKCGNRQRRRHRFDRVEGYVHHFSRLAARREEEPDRRRHRQPPSAASDPLTIPDRPPMESPFRADVLKGKVAVVTGGGSGIGFEIATQLARHGACVAVMGRRREALDKAVAALQSQGLTAAGFDGDVRKQEDAARVLAATVQRFGRLDILVNGAAGNFLASPEDLTPKGFRTVLEIDTVGTYTMCHEALKYLKKDAPSSSGGLIINISAIQQYTAAWYQTHLSAAKAGVDSITRSLALEWGTDYDIRVNGIAPGAIRDTPGMRKLAPEEMNERLQELMPLFKYGDKWDIAMAAIYLASDAGKFVNGATMIVDGGLWLSRPRHVPKEEVRALSKVVEKKVRSSAIGVPPSSKL